MHVINIMMEAAIRGLLCRDANPHLNLAVSGSISSSSLTGERGTLEENFSVNSEGLEGQANKRKKKKTATQQAQYSHG